MRRVARSGAAAAAVAGTVLLSFGIAHSAPLRSAVSAARAAIVPAVAQAKVTSLSAPDRTAVAVISLDTGDAVGTANSHESRPALSIAKLYLVEYALEHGDGSTSDLDLTEQAIRYSDDDAADQLDAEYPGAIDAVASEFGLADTSGDYWGYSYTSAADVASFLASLVKNDPSSPILTWMSTASPVASDGTDQNWGTVDVPGVEGTKWGWSDQGPEAVASASYGNGFIVVALTEGTPDDETDDVTQAVGGMSLATAV